ncbi:phosphate transport system permease protein [Sinimarinibacterium flocculans]|uniref:Phosphate transport system permease protein PstA n=2 Tax=Sinimarinibacterium flocculans TaxID=985250 RepID=A0A318EFX4_9GAMM|nr:phosphate ABC transporter permease PstA [Sinimarinibacterium flocculans]PXV71158.1 phosphate transport system permease protein [Sinimarinibacterium flocculans]
MEQTQTPQMIAQQLVAGDTTTVRAYVKSGQPWIWLTAAAISVAFITTVALLGLTAARGLPHFWPADLLQARYEQPGAAPVPMLAEVRSSEEVTAARLLDAGLPVDPQRDLYERLLLKIGNRDIGGVDFRYVVSDWLVDRQTPADAVVLERIEWGNFHGFLDAVVVDGNSVAGSEAWSAYQQAQRRVDALRGDIRRIEKKQIGAINYELERLRLQARRLEIDGKTRESHPEAFAPLDRRRDEQGAKYEALRAELNALNRDIRRDSVRVRTVDGQQRTIALAQLVHGYRPNRMGVLDKTLHFFGKVWEFVSDEPREANTEGGIFPAIFGTVLMVMIMSIVVTPFGILAALYLREYAHQGAMTRAIRIAVNNLAGVPSIVFGMFGLGFFVYFLGGGIDRLFYPEAAPAPVFGTPGILWASLTLALLTLPVVIVATEEGLARIPRATREASLALGATKAETLWRVVLPMASPAMMTGLILAIARAAGEVAPLMLVGVVKLAPTLPIDGNFPFIHFERKFMHLGFHIYDVGFQSPNVEAARPLVYATSFLLVLVVVLLNVSAIMIRNRLRERYKALDH